MSNFRATNVQPLQILVASASEMWIYWSLILVIRPCPLMLGLYQLSIRPGEALAI
jgi:hypothetical protein